MMDLDELLETLHLARRRFSSITATMRRTLNGGVIDANSLRTGSEAYWGGVEIIDVDRLWFSSTTRWRADGVDGSAAGMITGRLGDRQLRNFSLDDIAVWPPARHRYLGGPSMSRQVHWEPNLAVPLLYLDQWNEDEVAGRPVVLVRARPRPSSVDYLLIGTAHAYELAVDAERGVLLRFTCLYDGLGVAFVDEVLEIAFDADLPDTLFTPFVREGRW